VGNGRIAPAGASPLSTSRSHSVRRERPPLPSPERCEMVITRCAIRPGTNLWRAAPAEAPRGRRPPDPTHDPPGEHRDPHQHGENGQLESRLFLRHYRTAGRSRRFNSDLASPATCALVRRSTMRAKMAPISPIEGWISLIRRQTSSMVPRLSPGVRVPHHCPTQYAHPARLKRFPRGPRPVQPPSTDCDIRSTGPAGRE
jgi:hypothetical protein